MQNKPFDLAKLDIKTMQRQARKKLLKRSIIPTLLVVILALWFLLPTLLTAVSIGKYNKNKASSARTWLIPLTWTSPERYIVEFNTGTVDTKLGKYDRAETELNRALALAPPDKKCMVAQNLAFSYDAHAKSVADNKGQAAVSTSKKKDVIAANPSCFKGSSASGGGASSSSSSSATQAVSDAQQQQLQQKEQEGRDRQEQSAQKEEYDASKPQTKPW